MSPSAVTRSNGPLRTMAPGHTATKEPGLVEPDCVGTKRTSSNGYSPTKSNQQAKRIKVDEDLSSPKKTEEAESLDTVQAEHGSSNGHANGQVKEENGEDRKQVGFPSSQKVKREKVDENLTSDLNGKRKPENGQSEEATELTGVADPQEGWRDNPNLDLPSREKFLSEIYSRLFYLDSKLVKGNAQKAENLAMKLELALYRTSKSREEYSNIKTLQDRVRALYTIKSPASQVLEQILAAIQKSSGPYEKASEDTPKDSKPVEKAEAKPATEQADEPKEQVSQTDDTALITSSEAAVEKAVVKKLSRPTQRALSKVDIIKDRQRRLLMFYHSSKCKAEQCEFGEKCTNVKKLFYHVTNCTKETCVVRHCVSSRYLLIHFRTCVRPDCPVCTPVRLLVTQKKKEDMKKRKLSELHAALNTVSQAFADGTYSFDSGYTEKDIENFIDPKYARSCVSGTGPNLLQFKTVFSIQRHLSSLKVEKLQPIVFPVLRKLMEHKHNRSLFNFPVDIVQFKIPHYFDVVKEPMDLGTVRQRLIDGRYDEFDQFDHDVKLVFKNAMTFNPPNHPIHTLANNFLKHYEGDIVKLKPKLLNHYRYHASLFLKNQKSISTNSKFKCNLCHQDKCEICPLCERGCIGFEQKVLYCSGVCSTRIQRNVYYYCTPNVNYVFCTECFEKNKKKSFIEVQGGNKCKKADLQKRKNNDVSSEPWVSCDGCERWVHQICALFNPRKDDPKKDYKYYCPHCLIRKKEKGEAVKEEVKVEKLKDDQKSAEAKLEETDPPSPKKEEKQGTIPLSAADLPQTHLGGFVENWVRNHYRTLQANEKANPQSNGIIGDPGPDPDKLYVRVLHSCEEICKVRPYARKSLEKMPAKLRYTSRCLALFQELDGVDVLIFVMFVQEYGTHSASVPVDQSSEEKDEKDTNESEDSVFRPSLEKQRDELAPEGITVKKESVEAPVVVSVSNVEPGDLHNPNQDKIYIAYLDTIHYFRPRRFRTTIYHTLLLSYLEYCRRTGYVNAYIWACPPPNKRDDYILHCHPEDQRVPNPERLRKWYHSMVNSGKRHGIITDVSTLFEEHFESIPDKKKHDTKKRKSKKKAMQEIIAAGKPRGRGKGGKNKGKKNGSADSSEDSDEDGEGLGGGRAGNMKQALCDAWKLESLEERKKNKLAISQQMPYFDGDYWPQELEEIGKDEENRRRKKLKGKAVKEKVKSKLSVEEILSSISGTEKVLDDCTLEDLQAEDLRKVLFHRLAEQLNVMKQDFLVVKLAHECAKCGKYVKSLRYECRHKKCLVPMNGHGSIRSFVEAENNATAEEGKKDDSGSDVKSEPDSTKEEVGKVSSYVLCEACFRIERKKPLTERHGAQDCVIATRAASEKAMEVDTEIETVYSNIPEQVPEGKDIQEAHRAKYFNSAVELDCSRKPITAEAETHELMKVLENTPEETILVDDLSKSKLVENRHSFLALCASNKYQFNQLRRAKYSTMMVLYHLHNPEAPANLYTCSRCQKDILRQRRFCCVECNDFNLCELCYLKEKHEHRMNSFIITRGLQQTSAENIRYHRDSKRARQKSLFVSLKILEHAANCSNQTCPSVPCGKIKSMVAHNSTCTVQHTDVSCSDCRTLRLLVNLHSRRCRNDHCKFKLCLQLRSKSLPDTPAANVEGDKVERKSGIKIKLKLPKPSPKTEEGETPAPKVSFADPLKKESPDVDTKEATGNAEVLQAEEAKTS